MIGLGFGREVSGFSDTLPKWPEARAFREVDLAIHH